MIETCSGSIFEVEAMALVNPVNCMGVMGAGLAKQFRKRYPENFGQYNAACGQGWVKIGRVFTVQVQETPRRYVVNFPTKVHWKDPSQLNWIHRGLLALLRWIRREHIESVAIPKIGCGLGGLDWAEVKAWIVRIFGRYKTRIILVE